MKISRCPKICLKNWHFYYQHSQPTKNTPLVYVQVIFLRIITTQNSAILFNLFLPSKYAKLCKQLDFNFDLNEISILSDTSTKCQQWKYNTNIFKQWIEVEDWNFLQAAYVNKLNWNVLKTWDKNLSFYNFFLLLFSGYLSEFWDHVD